MNLLSIVVLAFVMFLSFIPVIRMNQVQDEHKYRCLKYLVNIAFLWTLVILLERLVSNMSILYYLHMTSFPIKFVLASFMVCTILHYTETKVPKWLLYILIIGTITEVVLVFLNQSYATLLQITPSEVTNLEVLYSAENGVIFYYHLVFIYVLLLASVAFLFRFVYQHRNIEHYRVISRTMGLSVVVVLSINLLQLLFGSSTIDLTYISLVIVSYMLYQVIFNRDMIYNLKSSGRGEILSNMREIYIILDDKRNVVMVSPFITEKYHVDSSQFIGKPFDDLVEELQQHIVIYINYDVDEMELSDKDHYHVREKKFELAGYKGYGYMVLMYDETQVYSLLRELNRLSYIDYMTGLHNRNYMEGILEEIQKEGNIGAISLDLNGLKVNNDYLGHERGDYLLKSLANVLKQHTKTYKNSYLARIGGDEFLILLRDTSKQELETIQQQILDACFDDDLEKRISVSIGIGYSQAEIDVYKLLRIADQNMYQMKQEESGKYADEIIVYSKKSEKYIR